MCVCVGEVNCNVWCVKCMHVFVCLNLSLYVHIVILFNVVLYNSTADFLLICKSVCMHLFTSLCVYSLSSIVYFCEVYTRENK